MFSNSRQTLQYLNRAAFDAATPLAQKRFGNLGYNAVIGPSQFTWDLGLHKSFLIHEQNRLTFRFEAFNWLNHPVFTLTNLSLSSATFGQITTSGLGRSLQLALKYNF